MRVYLFAYEYTVAVMLVKMEENRELSVYYISHSIKDTEQDILKYRKYCTP